MPERQGSQATKNRLTSDPPILGRKNCGRCKRWRYVATDFSYRLRKVKGHKELQPRVESVCKQCRSKREKEKYETLTLDQRRAKMKRDNTLRQKKLDKARTIEIEKKDLRRQLNGIQNGSLLPITPFRMWLIKKLKQYESIEQLRIATGMGFNTIEEVVKGYRWNESLTCDPQPIMTIPLSVVDRALTNEGSDSMRAIGYE